MTITVGAIERSVVAELPVPDQDDHRLDQLGEIEQQFQIAISGDAATLIAWAEIDLTFDVEFLDATYQRYSNLVDPQTLFGAVITGDDPVAVVGCVRAWVTDDQGAVVGATVAVGAHSPGAASPVAFEGSAHVSFQGYGSVPNEPADPDFPS